MPIRVVFAEDNYLVREGTIALFQEVDDLEIVESVGDLPTLLAAVDRHLPDAVLTDIRMPPSHTTEGIQAARQIREAHPGMGVLVLSQYAERASSRDPATEHRTSPGRSGQLLPTRETAVT